ncbi:MAG: hypothetical protein PHS92_00740 [Candidatus Gracilibacteria bacterium]|nr:hypothetical protein [Candidatus Gracilibacteria bacterium]
MNKICLMIYGAMLNLFSGPILCGSAGVDPRETPLGTDEEMARLKEKFAPAKNGW